MQSAILQPAPSVLPTPVQQKTQQKKAQVSPGISLLAGGIAGGVEAAITYPFEFTKTRSQLQSSIPGQNNAFQLVRHVIRTEGISALYVGCSTLVVGTAFKASVRFLTFDSIKNALADDKGKLSPARGILAGSAAGCVESIVAVTPTERIKTALIDDAKSSKRFQGSSFKAVRILVAENGISSLYKGLASTTMKQSATSAVRMGSYNVLRELAKSYNVRQNTATTFATGAIAGVVTVYATQPFDTIKTRAQSAKGASTVAAFRSVLKDLGVRGFWRGSSMRLGRLVLSGGIVFSVYEKIVELARSTGRL